MSYHLGVDLGTTYTCAAVHDAGRVEVVPLGGRGPSIPSVLYLREEGDLLAGDAAERHAVTQPERIAREFKRRLGDPTPMMLGSAAARAEVLTGNLLRWVYETVVRAQGAPPESLALTHPANWGTYKLDLFAVAAEVAGLDAVTMVTEPQAAAVSYASEARVEPGAVVGVYDLGGGTFDAAVLRKEADGGFTLLGSPDGIERLGGIDFDAAVFAHVAHTLDGAIDELDPDDDAALAAVSRLRQECTQAKEALSSDTEATIPVLLPNVQADVRLTREQFEEMIRPTLAETVTALQRALRSADLAPGDVDHVLLVGGSSRIPLVGQLVSVGLGKPVAIDAHPKHAIALGAAHVAARSSGVATVDAHTRTTQAVGGGAALPSPPAGVSAPPATDPLAGTRPLPPDPVPGTSVFGGPAGATPPTPTPTPAPASAPPRPAPAPAGPGQRPSPSGPTPAPAPAYSPAYADAGTAENPAYAGPAANADPDATIVFQAVARPVGPPPAAPPPGQPGGPPRPLPAPPAGPPPGRAATPPRPAGPVGAGGRHLPPPPGGPPPNRGYAAPPASPAGGYPQAPGTPSGGGYHDPSFDTANRQAAPSFGYQAANNPPAPGRSNDLPPGLLNPEEKAARKRREQRKQRVGLVVTSLIVLIVFGAAIAAILVQG